MSNVGATDEAILLTRAMSTIRTMEISVMTKVQPKRQMKAAFCFGVSEARNRTGMGMVVR